MGQVTVLINVVTTGGRQPERSPGIPAKIDRRTGGERRNPARHQAWQPEWLPSRSAEARAYRFRSLADRRAPQNLEAAAGSGVCVVSGCADDASQCGRADAGRATEARADPERQEVLIRVADGDGDGSRVRWLHVSL